MQVHTTKTTLTFSPTFLQRLKTAAQERNRSMSRLIEEELSAILHEWEARKLSKTYSAIKKWQGSGSHGITDASQTIDQTLYGVDGVWKGHGAA